MHGILAQFPEAVLIVRMLHRKTHLTASWDIYMYSQKLINE